MTQTEAKADVFLMALKSLPKRERDAVLVRIACDKALARDLVDLALIEQRCAEPSRPFRAFLARRKAG